jgi:hypothetical protein
MPDRPYIDGIGVTEMHRVSVSVRDGKLVRTILEGKSHPCITWSDGGTELTASIPELGIEEITLETNLRAIRTESGQLVVRPGQAGFGSPERQPDGTDRS